MFTSFTDSRWSLNVPILFNLLSGSQLRTPVSVLLGNPPQELAVAENALRTDTLGCSRRPSFYVSLGLPPLARAAL